MKKSQLPFRSVRLLVRDSSSANESPSSDFVEAMSSSVLDLWALRSIMLLFFASKDAFVASENRVKASVASFSACVDSCWSLLESEMMCSSKPTAPFAWLVLFSYLLKPSGGAWKPRAPFWCTCANSIASAALASYRDLITAKACSSKDWVAFWSATVLSNSAFSLSLFSLARSSCVSSSATSAWRPSMERVCVVFCIARVSDLEMRLSLVCTSLAAHFSLAFKSLMQESRCTVSSSASLVS
mmetsp:Transcript_73899/g.187418  ORF Transcript_73899/g.187418 Transcript_73899/m.187418 type:complete len:242 (+) Transcript_73899:72-797(+)